MTTNVFDANVGVIATDSRWSMTWMKWIVYVDDAGFHKIEIYHSHAFMFAGRGTRIQEWKNWIRSSPDGDMNMPSCDGISVCIVDTVSSEVIFSERQDIVKDGAYFAGTGSRFAYLCWDRNRNAKKSVETAKQVDFYSGGEVKFFNSNTKDHNLYQASNDVTIDMVARAIEERGMVMEIVAGKISSNTPFKLLELAANDKDMQELKGKIASGELSPEAPCDGMYSEWTKNQKSNLKAALSKVFTWK